MDNYGYQRNLVDPEVVFSNYASDNDDVRAMYDKYRQSDIDNGLNGKN